MKQLKEKTNTIPVKIPQLNQTIWAIQVLRSALDLKVFDQLEKGVQQPVDLAKELNVDERALEVLLDALVSIGLLQKEGSRYSLTDESGTYLVSTGPLFMGRFMQLYQERENMWNKLTEVIRSGKPVDEVNDYKRAQEFFPALAETIFPLSFALAGRVAEELKISQLPANAQILDVAAGSATWSIPMALANQSVHIDALDFPTTLEVTKKFATKYGVADRYSYLVGSWQDVKLQKNTYDVIILGHILHSEGPEFSKQLIGRCFDALKSDGSLVIAEMIANNDRGGPPFAMLFGINMLINTTEGCVFTDAELHEMLSAAGFIKAYRMSVDEMPYSPIMIAHKPG